MSDSTSTFVDGVVETVKTIVYALLIAGVFRTLFFQPFWIPSGSMKDTLLIGDFLFVNKMAYGYSQYSCPFGMCPIDGRVWGGEPERGDVAVFRHPVNGQDFIKRIVGVPGDTVQMRAGVLYVNGSPAPQVPDGMFNEVYERQGPIGSTPICIERQVSFGENCSKTRSIETLPDGSQHSVLDAGPARLDNTGVTRVPEGMYYFVGDNRDNSTDSRVAQPSGVGLVPYENLIGRADRVMFSSAGRSLFFVWTWRMDRFFKAVE
ncbi:MAG: signal peptidase I [Boseongicola sp.]|nr:signal peptidase I [Boseongicola sp.]